ncbi:acetyltransferase (GNAT) family protein [Arenicella xantha]|uniref:Acetyltransferase (GNAT) family protein n=2 Tax=Arenicella xantha TaxID=644221 RepID=A0A395JP75_9GAMM|nr:acetyltransferase (GNAT) family protein [Arenicella xantha]
MMTWFTSDQQITSWGGPGFRFPLSIHSFKEDLKLSELDSFALTDQSNRLLGFGQCYERLSRCHLGRLVINPAHRGRGLIAQLMTQLITFGREKFDTNEVSLFVLNDNHSALSAYQNFGFSIEQYPEVLPLENCSYMLKTY